MGGLTEREAYVAFNLTDKVGSVKLTELVAASGSVAAAWESYPQKVSRSGAKLDWEREFSLAKRYGVEIVTPADPSYPTRLLEQPSHPLALYVKGDASVLSSSSVAIVGTRRATAYGLDQAFKIAKGLAEDGWTVLSGLALGVDAESHRGALSAEGKTVGVIGSGLDEFYPEENRALAREIVENGGAVVSEFPFGRYPDTQKIVTHFDNDRTGVLAAEAIKILLQGKCMVVDSPPPKGKDFNDFLCMEKNIQRNKPPINRGERE